MVQALAHWDPTKFDKIRGAMKRDVSPPRVTLAQLAYTSYKVSDAIT
jgi:hypothetical protein